MPVVELQPYVQVAEVSKIYRSGAPNAVEALNEGSMPSEIAVVFY
jgi:hypothetical protein